MLVHLRGVGVGGNGGGIIPRPGVDVRGHVDEVAGRRREARQAWARHGALGLGRGLGGVDVVVVGADVVGIAGEHPLEHLDDLLGALGGVALFVVELPRAEVHRALGVERGGVEVVRDSGG